MDNKYLQLYRCKTMQNMTLGKIERQNDKCGLSYLADKSRRLEEKKILEIYFPARDGKWLLLMISLSIYPQLYINIIQTHTTYSNPSCICIPRTSTRMSIFQTIFLHLQKDTFLRYKFRVFSKKYPAKYREYILIAQFLS